MTREICQAIRAYVNASDPLQRVVRDMVDIILGDSTLEERRMAWNTIEDILTETT